MNSLDALAATAKEGAGIGWQAEADLAAGRLVRLLADDEPAPVPLYLMFRPSRLAWPKVGAFVDHLAERWRGVDPFGGSPASTDKQNQHSIL